MFANVMQNITDNMRMGLEYVRFDTHYVNQTSSNHEPNALDHRVQFSTYYYF